MTRHEHTTHTFSIFTCRLTSLLDYNRVYVFLSYFHFWSISSHYQHRPEACVFLKISPFCLGSQNINYKCNFSFNKFLIFPFVAVPCHVPVTENGIYKLNSREGGSQSALLNESSTIENGEVVEFSCKHGYNVQGPSNLRCWHGKWAITSLPDCTPGKWNQIKLYLTGK